MSLYGVLRTGVSGMTAQSNKLGTISDNIANTGTNGYKRASTEFSSLVLGSNSSSYDSGAVVTDVRYAIGQQGPLGYTTSSTDLAIQGNGFFLVSDPSGMTRLTRAGSFVVDASSGNLVNTAGYALMGYDISGGDPDVVLNGAGGLAPINLASMNLKANPSTGGTFMANLPSNADIEVAPLASSGVAGANYTAKSSVVAYDNLGNEVTLDVYLTKTGASDWEMAVFDRAQAAAGGGFPYGAGPLATQALTFDGLGQMTSATTMNLTVPGGQPLTLDLSGMTQLAADYTPLKATIDGSAPSNVSDVVIDDDGTVYAVYEDGTQIAGFRIPLASVQSPDNLSPYSGNVYATTVESGDMQIGFPTAGGLGKLVSGAIEQSNVDMASELTEMIVAQRDYTANSKVFQTGSELLDVLMNLKR